MKHKLDRLYTSYKAEFTEGGELFFSPSRINLIGEHIDYNGGQVLPCAIEIGTYALVRPRPDRIVRLRSLNIEGSRDLDLDKLSYRSDHSWLNYVAGMLKYIEEAGWRLGGFEGYIYGDIPNGAGLSSSASLEMLIGKIVNHLFQDNQIPQLDLVKIGQKTENQFIGVQTGIMDQFAIGLAREGMASLINTDSLDYRYIPLDLADYSIVIMNTNKRRELADSKYNQRRSECELGLKTLQEHFQIANLCQFSVDLLDRLDQYIGDELILRRVRHVVTENKRVREAVLAMESGDLVSLGRLLNASHQSLRDDYEVTGPELDAIVAAAQDYEACLGARMTGAGFGGCAIAIVRTSSCDGRFQEFVDRAYRAQSGLKADFYSSRTAGGPCLLEVE